MDDLGDLQAWISGLLARATPASRLRLARMVATDLRRSTYRRIAQQRNPDGSPYEPRRQPLRTKAGRVRRAAMFQRLRQGSHMRARADASEAAVEFTTRASRIARVHQQGLVDRVRPGGPRVAYARRELLGFTRADVKLLQQRVLEHLAGAGL